MKRLIPVSFMLLLLMALTAFVGIHKYLISGSSCPSRQKMPGNPSSAIFSRAIFQYSTAIKGLLPGKRTAAVREMGGYIRKTVNGPEFADQYKLQRESAK
jgi:hypothetical protein